MPDEVKIRRWFPAVPEAVPQARGWVAQIAAATGHAAMAPTAELLVSKLAIVDKLADQWGVELRRHGKCLWFKLSDPPENT